MVVDQDENTKINFIIEKNKGNYFRFFLRNYET